MKILLIICIFLYLSTCFGCLKFLKIKRKPKHRVEEALDTISLIRDDYLSLGQKAWFKYLCFMRKIRQEEWSEGEELYEQRKSLQGSIHTIFNSLNSLAKCNDEQINEYGEILTAALKNGEKAYNKIKAILKIES